MQESSSCESGVLLTVVVLLADTRLQSVMPGSDEKDHIMMSAAAYTYTSSFSHQLMLINNITLNH